VLPNIRTNAPHPYAALKLQPADEAYKFVLAKAGATLPMRDAVDERVVRTVRTGKVTAKAGRNVEASLTNANFSEELVAELIADISKGIITHPDQVGGYPEYKGTPYKDADADGLPDAWEKKHGLNPNDPTDVSADADSDGYANVEEFLNGTDPRKFVDYTKLENNPSTSK
jgi:hypothetical protein